MKTLVTVLMPVFNAAAYVEAAVQSMLDQSYREFELIVIDDGSTDDTLHKLKKFDGKIKVFTQNRSGIVAALNRGLSLAGGEYIARMDADDVSLPQRLEVQVNFLDSHPAVGIVGSAVRVIDGAGRRWGIQSIESSDVGIRWMMLFKNPFIHPAVMFRKSILERHGLKYGAMPHAEDYELWTQMIKYGDGHNLVQPLLLYRVHNSNVSIQYRNTQFESVFTIAREMIHQSLPDVAAGDDQIADVISLALSPSRGLAGMGHRRTEAIKTYLSLWEAFKEKHGSQDLGQVQRSVIRRVVGWALYPPLPPEVIGIVRSLRQIDPLWYLRFLETLPNSVLAFARERLVWRL